MYQPTNAQDTIHDKYKISACFGTKVAILRETSRTKIYKSNALN